jgi:hypothetical protein
MSGFFEMKPVSLPRFDAFPDGGREFIFITACIPAGQDVQVCGVFCG